MGSKTLIRFLTPQPTFHLHELLFTTMLSSWIKQ